MSANAVDASVIRDIKIKTGIVKRLLKEKISYEKESAVLQKKVDQMRAANEEEYYIKKQEELLAESQKMVPDCETRFIAAWEGLSKLLEFEVDVKDTDEYKAAQLVIEESRSAIPH